MKPYITSSLDELAQTFKDAADGIQTGRHLREADLLAITARDFPHLRKRVRQATLRMVVTIIRQTELRPPMSQAARMLYECSALHTHDHKETKALLEALKAWLAVQPIKGQ